MPGKDPMTVLTNPALKAIINSVVQYHILPTSVAPATLNKGATLKTSLPGKTLQIKG
jgi:hypothetical protein